ncbi:UbiA prenyltransferase [Devosia riboflavina]|uniref:UbiA prenyltransferase n=1 Tax=Devosia riboflavina TaxID=46914 RepID=A0A087LZA7_9HYPH|nr:UbiA family prenyltransferase [Devosia riboflavina]KFL29960.1 UbiA prenyltransferase [Devosia riboflavina]
MNVRVQNSKDLPLAVDLDGTLISADLLWESIFQLLKKNPLFLFMLPVWLMAGKAHLKAEIASRVDFDAAILPYRQEFLDFLNAEKATGREIVLVTAAAEPFASAVAAHLGIFTTFHASSRDTNLAAHRKAALLVEHFGEGGFDYAGNDRADIPVFKVARAAVVVAPDRTAHRYQQTSGARRFERTKPSWKTYVKMLRVHQWLKNLLVFAPAILAHQITNPEVLLPSLGAFVAFCAAASAIYIINDILDLPLDRQHATKRNRPFANGTLSIPFGLSVSAGLIAIAVVVCVFLPPVFALVIGLYVVSTTAYSLAVKRMLLIDVLCLAGLYTLRIIGGKAAADLPLSFWLIAFSMFFFLSLALVKRYVELQTSKVSERDRIAGRGYRPEDMAIVGQAGIASAFTATLVLSLYIQSQEIIGYYSSPWLIWPLVPIVLYIVIRIWILAYRREMHDDPVVFIATDWRSQIFVAFGALLMIAGNFI